MKPVQYTSLGRCSSSPDLEAWHGAGACNGWPSRDLDLTGEHFVGQAV